ncbi:2' cyclic ADP-D-ribose synthase AbTIR-like [Branchiostoma floridae x Branchiostoma japonicum]
MASAENNGTIEDLIKDNYELLSKRLQVEKLIPQFIQRRLLDFPEKQVIMSKVTTPGKAEALLQLLSEKGTCTPGLFVEILKKGDHRHIVDHLQWTSTQNNSPEGPQVFICHAGPDKARFVRPLVQQLQEEGLPEDKIFFDEISLSPGDDFAAEIRATLSSTSSLKLVVFVISQHVLNDRYWPKLELELTLQANKKIFPIWLDQNEDGFTDFGSKLRKYSPTLKEKVGRKVLVDDAGREMLSIAEEIVRKLETS